MSPEDKANLSKKLKAKWASGGRKKNPPETYLKSSATMKKNYAEGRQVAPKMTREQSNNIRTFYSREKMMEVNRKSGGRKIGVPNTGRGAASEDNWKAKYWILKAPNREIIQGRNLNEIIRRNVHLFLPDDVVWVKCKCRASKGIARLFEMKEDGTGPKTLSWKGWTIGDKFP